MYYTIFKNENTGNFWFKKFKSKQKQTRAIIGVVKLTNNSLHDNLTTLSDVKFEVKDNNSRLKYVKKYKY